MRKRGDMSLQVIVVAALLLVVLIILIAIFAGRSRYFVNSIEDCTSKGGIETKSPSDACPDGSTPVPMKKGQYCCIKIIEQPKATTQP